MTSKQERLKGLYIITDRPLSLECNQPIEEMVASAIAGGARIVQYRNKQSALSIRRYEAQQLAQLCREQGVTFLINDDVELALEVGADGVHLGQTDTPCPIARKLLGEDRIIGVTCHAEPELAQKAQDEGADYVAFGRFYHSHSKPAAPPASLSVLETARQHLTLPICAIGGIRVDNAAPLLQRGTDMLAVIEAVLGARQIKQAAQAFSELFQNTPHSPG